VREIRAVTLACYRVKELIAILKKINATKNFTAGAITARPKKEFLAQKHIIQRIDH